MRFIGFMLFENDVTLYVLFIVYDRKSFIFILIFYIKKLKFILEKSIFCGFLIEEKINLFNVL